MHDTTTASPAFMITLDGHPVHLHLVEAGLACCAVEQSAATSLLRGVAATSEPATGADQTPLNVLVVSGTVTDAMAPWLVRAFEAMSGPRAVMSFGACAATGGPYWDSYVVTNGIDQLLPVDMYVPGCPPTPEAFVQGLSALVASVRAVASGGQAAGGSA